MNELRSVMFTGSDADHALTRTPRPVVDENGKQVGTTTGSYMEKDGTLVVTMNITDTELADTFRKSLELAKDISVGKLSIPIP